MDLQLGQRAFQGRQTRLLNKPPTRVFPTPKELATKDQACWLQTEEHSLHCSRKGKNASYLTPKSQATLV